MVPEDWSLKKPDNDTHGTLHTVTKPLETAPSARLRGGAAFRVHLGLFFCLLICIPAGAFELSRALGGNELSWAYVFEWPLFAIFGFYMWWKLLHGGEPIRKRSAGEVAVDEKHAAENTEQLAAWNAYLEELSASSQNEDT